MSDVIRLLPDSVANQIAAGEVIQRPAAVIKELVENAVDAGATTIRIYVKDAGKTLIQVVDNGCGMTETDARMAFERHATSKIRKADDLFNLHTMGFRGEALPSICAISEVELRTRVASDAMGTRILIEGSKVIEQEPCVCEVGSSFSVKRLFWNVPARRRFLKSDSVELANVMREFERMALVNNHLHLSIDTGNREIDLHPASFKQRIMDLWKNNLNMELLPVEIETDLVKISGFVSRPEHARKRNPLQYLIVNGRNMRHPYFHRAILNCFENLIPSDSQPCYFLKFEVDPERIDVNIHPTKNEIKFTDESEIWSILSAAVRSSLGRNGAVPSIDFQEDPLHVRPASPGEFVKAPALDLKPGYNPFESGKGSAGRSRIGVQWKANTVSRDWDKLYRGFVEAGKEDLQEQAAIQEQEAEEEALPGLAVVNQPEALCLQVENSYIVTASDKGLMLIDQHRAHVRILYERFLESVRASEAMSQKVLFPDLLTLDSAQEAILEKVMPELRRLGFELEKSAPGEWLIVAVPGSLTRKSPVDLIVKVIDSESDDSATYGAPQSRTPLERVALVAAQASAIQRGQPLTPSEMEQLLADLFSLPEWAYSPGGSAVVKIFDREALKSLFS